MEEEKGINYKDNFQAAIVFMALISHDIPASETTQLWI